MLSEQSPRITTTSGEDALDITPVADGAAIDINLPASYNLATGAIDIDDSTGSGPVIDIAFSSTYTGGAIDINMTNAVGASAIVLTGAGTRVVPLITIDTPGKYYRSGAKEVFANLLIH